MNFMTSYKKLEQLCRDITGADRPVSAYIDEMKNTPQGPRFVPGWDDDLKKLKHYRWVRNQIVHETGKTEENMCTSVDVAWLEQFYSRILNRDDPLARYYLVMKQRAAKKATPPKDSYELKVNDWYKAKDNNDNQSRTMLLFVAVIIVLVCLLSGFAIAMSLI